jgi:hypothetical protein
MFFGLEGYAELAFLVPQLEFASFLFSGEIVGIFNHSSNVRVGSDQLSAIICTRLTPDLVSHAQRTTFKGIQYSSLAKLLFLLCPEWDCNLIPTRS